MRTKQFSTEPHYLVWIYSRLNKSSITQYIQTSATHTARFLCFDIIRPVRGLWAQTWTWYCEKKQLQSDRPERRNVPETYRYFDAVHHTDHYVHIPSLFEIVSLFNLITASKKSISGPHKNSANICRGIYIYIYIYIWKLEREPPEKAPNTLHKYRAFRNSF